MDNRSAGSAHNAGNGNVPDPGINSSVLMINNSMIVEYASESAAVLLGYNRDEIKGLHSAELFCPESLILVANFLQENRNTGRALHALINIRHNNGALSRSKINLKELGESNSILVYLKQLSHDFTHFNRDEKEYLARELHDNINQTLTATKLILENALLTPNYQFLIQLAIENISVLIPEIQELSEEITSGIAREKNIWLSWKNMTATYVGTTLSVNLHMDDQLEYKLTKEQKHHLFRITQECLTNIVKHAAASKVMIGLTKNNEHAILSIQDNGVGFDKNKNVHGSGLRNIQNRTRTINGTFAIDSREDSGTRIEITTPLIMV